MGRSRGDTCEICGRYRVAEQVALQGVDDGDAAAHRGLVPEAHLVRTPRVHARDQRAQLGQVCGDERLVRLVRVRVRVRVSVRIRVRVRVEVRVGVRVSPNFMRALTPPLTPPLS